MPSNGKLKSDSKISKTSKTSTSRGQGKYEFISLKMDKANSKNSVDIKVIVELKDLTTNKKITVSGISMFGDLNSVWLDSIDGYDYVHLCLKRKGDIGTVKVSNTIQGYELGKCK